MGKMGKKHETASKVVPVLVRQTARASRNAWLTRNWCVQSDARHEKTRLRTLPGGGGKFQGQGEAKAPLIGRSLPFRDKRGPALAANRRIWPVKRRVPCWRTPIIFTLSVCRCTQFRFMLFSRCSGSKQTTQQQ
jgi:hypothetical protein